MPDHPTTQPRWLVLLVRLPTEPSRHRVAVWRELRKTGALSLAPGVWAVPEVPAFADRIERARSMADRASGEVITLVAEGLADTDRDALRGMFDAAREDDWAEFRSDCAKYLAEIAKEIRQQKYTLAELEEEEQSLDRLRRWHRELVSRDVFSAPSGPHARDDLKRCTEAFDDYAERTYAALHQLP